MSDFSTIPSNMCYHPWVGLDISPQGEFKPCCKYKNTINVNSITEYQQNDELNQLKEDFLNGLKPTACKRCWDDEDAGLPSKRILDQKYIFHNNQPELNSLKVLSLPFGNACNLACRICDSYSSSGWIVESKKLQDHFPNIKIYKHQRFYQNQIFIDQIKKISQHVNHFEFPGGEPFLDSKSKHLEFLDYIISHNNVANISLHYITNVTIFPSIEYWNRWKNFKNVDIQLSIDGLESQFEYNRWPAKWNTVITNVQKYVDYRLTYSNIQLSISHTVSIFTIYYLPEFVKWCLQHKLNKPYLGVLANPLMYDVRCLPISVKDIIATKLNKFKFDHIVKYMYSDDLSNQFSNSLNYIKVLDQQRNQSFELIFSEFNKILREYI